MERLFLYRHGRESKGGNKISYPRRSVQSRSRGQGQGQEGETGQPKDQLRRDRIDTPAGGESARDGSGRQLIVVNREPGWSEVVISWTTVVLWTLE